MGAVSKDVGRIITAQTRMRSTRAPLWTVFPEELAHIQHIGEVMHAWNCAHGALFRVFARIAADANYELAHGLWHTVQSDKTQREMLEAVVRSKYKKSKLEYRDGILWAIAALNELAIHRNDAAHAEMVSYYDRMVPGMSAKRGTTERFTERPLAKQWRTLRGDLYALMNYLNYVDFALWWEYPRPLSHKPKLQLARAVSERTQERHRRAKKAARERQRRSSQA